MGNDRAEQQKRRTPPKAATGKKRIGQGGGETGAVADWRNVNPDVLVWFVELATRDDCAVRFGYSRDGGAYSLGIYADGASETLYLSGKEDVSEWLTRLGREVEET